MVRIGLVDDDSEHLKLMREFLGRYEREEKVGFSIEEYRDGLSFVEDYDGTLDVVFLDIEMPHIDGMTAAIREDTVRILFHIRVEQKVEREPAAKVTGTNKDDSAMRAPVRKVADKIYPNDPCPCGSGKKYKQCCGRIK